MGEFDGFFEDALALIVRDVVADGDDDWFERAADGTPSVDERATASREAIGAAALSPGRELARRVPRRHRRRRNAASTNAECGGRPPRRPVGAGALLVVVLFSLALLTRAPHTRDGAEPSTRAWSATTARALGSVGVAVARRRRRTEAVRRANQPGRTRRHPARARSQRPIHPRRRSRPVAPRPMTAAPAPPIAVEPAPPIAVARPGAPRVRRLARRPLRSPDPSFTPGDLPPAPGAR
jgi:hypothetical protein